MRPRILCALVAMGLMLSLGGCGGQDVAETVLPSPFPVVATPTPIPPPTPTPTPEPTLSPMERKYSDFDPEAAQLYPMYQDDSCITVGEDSVEYELTECLYGTYYWEDDDTPLVIEELTFDGREYRVHAMREYIGYDALSVLFSYADEPEQLYQLNKCVGGSDPYFYSVEVYPLDDGSSTGERIANEYSWAELEAMYEAAEPEPDVSTVPDGTVAYFRFQTEIGKYKVRNGQYVLQQAWTWINNEITQWDNTGRPVRRKTNNSLPPVETNVYYFLPDSFSADNCPYKSCPSSTIDDGYSTAMFSTQDNA